MVRISDTVNRNFREDGKIKPKLSEIRVSSAAVKEERCSPAEETDALNNSFKEEAKAAPESSDIRVSPATVKKAGVFPIEETEKLYNKLLFFAEEMMITGVDQASLDIARITGVISRLVDQLKSGNEGMLKLALMSNPRDAKNYLSYHSVNTSIFSLVIGFHSGWGEDRLVELGIAAFFHDIGMVKYMALAARNKSLSANEYNDVKGHARSGANILRRVGNTLPEAVIQAILQHHERADGSGYPGALKGDVINEYARIISLADVYEAMTHSRAHRGGYTPLDAIKNILESKEKFGYKPLKALIEKIGVFPVGSFVDLKDGRRAEVIAINPGNPLRPIVETVPKSNLDEKKIIDLSVNYNIFIERAVKQ